MTSDLSRIVFIACALMLAIAAPGDALAHSSSKMEKQINEAVSKVTSEMQGKLDPCRSSLDTARNNNDLLIETNARLTSQNARLISQLDEGKLDSLASGVDLQGRLSECEFRIRELEDSITDKQNQMNELEYEVETYSEEVRAVLEEKQALVERQKSEHAEAEAIQVALHALADEFAVEFENSIREGVIAYGLRPGYFSVTLRNAFLFKPDGVDVSSKGKGVLRRVAGALKSLDDLNDWDITVSGHTDNVAPGKSQKKQFPTNWEMSQVRAVNIVHYLVDHEGFEPARLGAKGYGEHRPEVSNKTLQGRSKNLRVVISVIRAHDAPPASKSLDSGPESGQEPGPSIGPDVEYILEPEPQVQENN